MGSGEFSRSEEDLSDHCGLRKRERGSGDSGIWTACDVIWNFRTQLFLRDLTVILSVWEGYFCQAIFL